MAGRKIKYNSEEERRQAKLASNKISKEKAAKRETKLTNQQKLFAQYLPFSKNASDACRKAGYSESSVAVVAHKNLKNSAVLEQIKKEEKNLRQAFRDRGLDEDYLARNFKEVIDYNQEKVKKFGANGEQYEEMRDAKVVASTLVNVAKISGSSMELVSNTTVDVNSNVAWLAIKSLIKKLDKNQLKMLIESAEAL